MTITVPRYIPQSMLEDPSLRYTWDDTKVFSEYCFPVNEQLVLQWSDLVEAAICGLTIAISEWIFFRLSRFDNDPRPLQCLEAAWCANVDRRYSEGLEVSKREWLGPVRGPMMAAMGLLHATLYEAQEGPDKPIDGPSLMSNLVEHVCGAKDEFRHWRAQGIERLRQYYIAPDPLEDLYGEQTAGIVVPREAFDPEFPFNPDNAPRLVDQFLRSVDYTKNPFLQSPQGMIEDGFQDTPYTLQ